MREQLWHYGDDSPEAMAQKVRFVLQEVGMDVEARAPYLLQLLGVKEGTESLAALSPEAIKTQTFGTPAAVEREGESAASAHL